MNKKYYKMRATIKRQSEAEHSDGRIDGAMLNEAVEYRGIMGNE